MKWNHWLSELGEGRLIFTFWPLIYQCLLMSLIKRYCKTMSDLAPQVDIRTAALGSCHPSKLLSSRFVNAGSVDNMCCVTSKNSLCRSDANRRDTSDRCPRKQQTGALPNHLWLNFYGFLIKVHIFLNQWSDFWIVCFQGRWSVKQSLPLLTRLKLFDVPDCVG